MDDFNGERSGRRMLVELALDRAPIANQYYSVTELPGCVNGAFDFGTRSLVAAHRVYGNGYHSFRLTRSIRELFRGGFDDFAAFILSAFRANAVRLLRLVAVGAFGTGGPGEAIMRAAGLRALVGMSAFRIWHCFLSCVFLILCY
jgi:hypothetical protein